MTTKSKMGDDVPSSQPKPTPARKSALQAALDRDAQLDSTYKSILRKCCIRDCRFERRHSFVKGTPATGMTYVHAHCGALDCRTCGPRHIELLRGKLNAAIRQYGLLYCYTFTLPARFKGNPLAFLRDKLIALKAKHLRGTGEELRYIAVKSVGSRGRHHLHLLTDTKWREQWIKDWWFKKTGAFEVDRWDNTMKTVDRLTNYMIINYLQCFRHGVRLKKITTSAGIDIRIRKPRRKDGRPSEWTRSEVSTRIAAAAAFGVPLESYPDNPKQVVVPPKPVVVLPKQSAALGRSHFKGGGAERSEAERGPSWSGVVVLKAA